MLTMTELTTQIGQLSGPVLGLDLALGGSGAVSGVQVHTGQGLLRWADRKPENEDSEIVENNGKFLNGGDETRTFERAENEASFYGQAFDSAVRGINIAGGAAQMGAGGKFIGAGVALCATGAGCVVGGPSVLLGTGLGLLGMSNIQEGVSGDDGYVRLIAGELLMGGGSLLQGPSDDD